MDIAADKASVSQKEDDVAEEIDYAMDSRTSSEEETVEKDNDANQSKEIVISEHEDISKEPKRESGVKFYDLTMTTWQVIDPPEPKLKRFTFAESSPGLRNIPKEVTAPEHFASLFLDTEFLSKLADDTNSIAEKYISSKQSTIFMLGVQIPTSEWSKTSSLEMQAFLALALACGLLKKPDLTSFWDEKTSFFATPGFEKVMTKNRFLLLLNFVCYDFKQVPEKLASLVAHFNDKFVKYFVPDCDIYIEDVVIRIDDIPLYIVHHTIANASTTWGTRVWQLCETNSGYCCKIVLSNGIREEVEHSTVERLIYNMMEKYLDKGYHLHTSTLCAFRELCDALYERKTHITGSLCGKAQHLPLKMKWNKQPSKHEQVYYRRGPVLATKYRDSKRDIFVFMSTLSQAGNIIAVTENREFELPEIVHTLATGLGLRHAKYQFTWYPDTFLSIPSNTKVLFNILSRALQNAFVLSCLVNKHQASSSYNFYADALANLASQAINGAITVPMPSTSTACSSAFTFETMADTTPMINPASITTIELNKWNSLG